MRRCMQRGFAMTPVAGCQARRSLAHAARRDWASVPLLLQSAHRPRGFATMIPVPQMGDSITEGELAMILGAPPPPACSCRTLVIAPLEHLPLLAKVSAFPLTFDPLEPGDTVDTDDVVAEVSPARALARPPTPRAPRTPRPSSRRCPFPACASLTLRLHQIETDKVTAEVKAPGPGGKHCFVGEQH